MGTYHQGGVVPTQIHLASNNTDINHVLWWKTYSPPIWLLNGRIEDVQTTDLMGMNAEEVKERLFKAVTCTRKQPTEGIVLVAPFSATYLDQFSKADPTQDLILQERWRYMQHINLDDLDIETDGVWNTLTRVVGRRGLVVWDVARKC
jgi:phosphatidylinositol glycan class Z